MGSQLTLVEASVCAWLGLKVTPTESWSDASLTSAMRGMENEEKPSYTVADLKALF